MAYYFGRAGSWHHDLDEHWGDRADVGVVSFEW
jgi:hypothetical protein